MTPAKIRIRRGKLADLAQVKTFTSDTFSWGDYLPDAWTNWVRSKRGVLLVAESERSIVGTLHVRYLEHREAWLEGVRVRHDFRQRGIASILIQAAHAYARRARCRVIRLETGVHNIAARRTFEKFGYQCTTRFAGFRGDASAGELNGVRLAVPADVRACWEMWQSSWVKRATQGIVPAVYGWRWWELTQARLLDDIRGARVWIAPRAFISLRELDENLDITLVVGTKRDALKLLSAARVLAHQKKRVSAYWITPHVSFSRVWAEQAIYTLDDESLLIYECKL